MATAGHRRRLFRVLDVLGDHLGPGLGESVDDLRLNVPRERPAQPGLLEGAVVDADHDDVLGDREIPPSRKPRVDRGQLEPLENVWRRRRLITPLRPDPDAGDRVRRQPLQGEILPELEWLKGKRIIRIVDMPIVRKDAERFVISFSL